MPLSQKHILLIISGGIAAYKSLDLIRRLRERGAKITPVMTQAALEFITPLAVGSLAAQKVHTDLFSRDDEVDVGHIRLARQCDLVVVAPATADLMGKMANGLANDLASTILLATTAPVLMVPAMNPKMWSNPAVLRNAMQLFHDGVHLVGPMQGEMAESGEAGLGRMAEPLEIIAAIELLLLPDEKPLAGRRALVTSGPTHEPIDPLRYIANRSSGKQGHAIAKALARAGAEVTLISGPVHLPDPDNVTTIHIERAEEMESAVLAHLPVDIAVMVAAVADWRVSEVAGSKIKKQAGSTPPTLLLRENPDILKTLGHHAMRPKLVIGFAAETDSIEKNGFDKLNRKGADFIIANDVSVQTGIMGGDRNQVAVIGHQGIDHWPDLTKDQVAQRLVALIAQQFR